MYDIDVYLLRSTSRFVRPYIQKQGNLASPLPPCGTWRYISHENFYSCYSLEWFGVLSFAHRGSCWDVLYYIFLLEITEESYNAYCSLTVCHGRHSNSHYICLYRAYMYMHKEISTARYIYSPCLSRPMDSTRKTHFIAFQNDHTVKQLRCFNPQGYMHVTRGNNFRHESSIDILSSNVFFGAVRRNMQIVTF